MDKKTIAVIVAVILTAVGALTQIDFKAAVCGVSDASSAQGK